MKSPSRYLLQSRGREEDKLYIYIGGVNVEAEGFRVLKERPEVVLRCDAVTSVNPTKKKPSVCVSNARKELFIY